MSKKLRNQLFITIIFIILSFFAFCVIARFFLQSVYWLERSFIISVSSGVGMFIRNCTDLSLEKKLITISIIFICSFFITGIVINMDHWFMTSLRISAPFAVSLLIA